MGRLGRDIAGNTLAIVAGAMAPLLAMVGSGIDLGRSYLSEARLQQACDAGVLAARKRLGSAAVASGVIPSNVADTGNSFFNINFSDGSYGTEDRTFTMTLEPDYAISGVATVTVPTAVMKIFGTDNIPITVHCEAKLNFSNTDVMMVLDTTGSMRDTNPGDTVPKIDALRNVVKNFYTQLEAAKTPGTRIRYGFVPYSTNVNVGALLKDDWVVSNWHYQTRAPHHTATSPGTSTYTTNWVYKSGTEDVTTYSTYPATLHPAATESDIDYYTCDGAQPANTSTGVYTLLSTVDEPYAGPPAGTKTTKHYRRVLNGAYYWTDLIGQNCRINKAVWTDFTHEYDEITVPVEHTTQFYEYNQFDRDVSNWRNETNGCIEERSTYEIDDYSNVDLTRALDLDLDTVPTAGDPDTQWRPMYKDIIFERRINWYGTGGNFNKAPYITSNAWAFFMPANYNSAAACPVAARKLAEMTSAQVDSYLASLYPQGYTYHDIGMIWGGRLISSTGLFASENADIDGKPTNRNLIFLTDGETHPMDISYSSYGVEPLDERRCSGSSCNNLTPIVEARFAFACNEVKKKNVTVWVIGFGTTMTDLMKQCAGDDQHWFQADNATELNEAFSNIAKSMGELRVSK